MQIYNKGGTEKLVIMDVRQGLSQRFVAPNWLDLRVGFLLSITDKTGNDTIGSLAETLTATPFLGPWDRYYIGLIHQDSNHIFIGFTNRGITSGFQTVGDSVLSLSDAGVGAGTDYYWPHNSERDSWSGQIVDRFNERQLTRVQSQNNVQQHFNAGGAPGYATLLMLRLQRDDLGGRSNIITTTMKQGTLSTDVLFTDDPSETILQENLEGFPGTVQTWGPLELTQVPDALYLYWPFHNSRLRIHAMGVLKSTGG